FRFRNEIPPRSLICSLDLSMAKLMEAHHVQITRRGTHARQMIGQLSVVASKQGFETFRGKAAGLFERQNSLARASTATHCDPSVRAQEIKNSHLVLRENQSASLLLGEARRHKRRHDERSREYLSNHVNAATADGGAAPRAATPIRNRAGCTRHRRQP